MFMEAITEAIMFFFPPKAELIMSRSLQTGWIKVKKEQKG
jgi:hypothetical protein